MKSIKNLKEWWNNIYNIESIKYYYAPQNFMLSIIKIIEEKGFIGACKHFSFILIPAIIIYIIFLLIFLKIIHII